MDLVGCIPRAPVTYDSSKYLIILENGPELPYLVINLPPPAFFPPPPKFSPYFQPCSSSSTAPVCLDVYMEFKEGMKCSGFIGHLDVDAKLPIVVGYARWGRDLYAIGGLDREGYQMSSRITRFRVTDVLESALEGGLPRGKSMTSMHSGKGSIFMSLEYNHVIYVLSSHFKQQPQYTFEGYRCQNDTWEILPVPPFHYGGWPPYFTSSGDVEFSWVVMEGRICISTHKGAFAYDIDSKKWETSHLFDDFGCVKPEPRWEDRTRELLLGRAPYVGQLNFKLPPPPVPGIPFKFHGGGIVFQNNILICMSSDEKYVLAYRIESGKAVEKQDLIYLPFYWTEEEMLFPGQLVYLEDGSFSLTFKRIMNSVLEFLVLIFRVYLLEEDACKDTFLGCDIIYFTAVDGKEDYTICSHTSTAVAASLSW